MFELFVVGAGSLILGALLPRKGKKEESKKCAAAWEVKVRVDSYNDKLVWTHCQASADPRCRGGNCTAHCRDKERCKGSCIDALDKVLDEEIE